MRGLVILRGATAAYLQKPAPLKFLADDDAKRIISEYNLRHQEPRVGNASREFLSYAVPIAEGNGRQG